MKRTDYKRFMDLVKADKKLYAIYKECADGRLSMTAFLIKAALYFSEKGVPMKCVTCGGKGYTDNYIGTARCRVYPVCPDCQPKPKKEKICKPDRESLEDYTQRMNALGEVEQ